MSVSWEASNALRRVHTRENRGHTTPASRHVRIIATNLLRDGVDHMLRDEPEHAALSLLSVVEGYLRRDAQVRRWARQVPEIALELEREEAEMRRRIGKALDAMARERARHGEMPRDARGRFVGRQGK